MEKNENSLQSSIKIKLVQNERKEVTSNYANGQNSVVRSTN